MNSEGRLLLGIWIIAGVIYAIVLISAITSIPISEKQDVPAYFQKYTDRDNCEIIPTKKLNIWNHYGTVCYEGQGDWFEVGFGGMPDSVYQKRVQPVKDSLAQNSEWW